MKILVTGAAGFIGFHLEEELIDQSNIEVMGIDNINDYYDVNLKYARLKESGVELDKVGNCERSLNYVQSNKHKNYQLKVGVQCFVNWFKNNNKK